MGEIFSKLLSLATDVAIRLVAAMFVLVVGRIAIKWTMKLIKKTHFSRTADPTVVKVLNNFTRAALYVILTISVIAILGVPMASVITVMASAGVAIGLALQGALSNLAGGIIIMIIRPFRIGDFVEINDNLGTVKDIGIFYTVIHTGDNKVITIPNGTVMASDITNYSVNDTRRIDMTFEAAYGTDPKKVVAILEEEIQKQENALKDPAPFARMTSHGDNGLVFTVRIWVKKENFLQVNLDLLEAVTKRFEEENIEVPFNQLDVHITK